MKFNRNRTIRQPLEFRALYRARRLACWRYGTREAIQNNFPPVPCPVSRSTFEKARTGRAEGDRRRRAPARGGTRTPRRCSWRSRSASPSAAASGTSARYYIYIYIYIYIYLYIYKEREREREREREGGRASEQGYSSSEEPLLSAARRAPGGGSASGRPAGMKRPGRPGPGLAESLLKGQPPSDALSGQVMHLVA